MGGGSGGAVTAASFSRWQNICGGNTNQQGNLHTLETVRQRDQGGVRLLVAGAVYALPQRPLQILMAHGLQHVVPQCYRRSVVGFAREMKAVWGEVGAIRGAVSQERDVGVDHKRLVNHRPIFPRFVPASTCQWGVGQRGIETEQWL